MPRVPPPAKMRGTAVSPAFAAASATAAPMIPAQRPTRASVGASSGVPLRAERTAGELRISCTRCPRPVPACLSVFAVSIPPAAREICSALSAPRPRPGRLGGLRRRATCDPRQCALQRGRGVDPGGKPFEQRRGDQRVTRKVDEQLAGERLALVEPRGHADGRAGLAVESALARNAEPGFKPCPPPDARRARSFRDRAAPGRWSARRIRSASSRTPSTG